MQTQITWQEYADNIVIQDITDEYFEQVKEFLRINLVPKNVVLKYLDVVNDPEAIENLMQLAEAMMREGFSLMVIDTNTKEIHGVAILNVMITEDRSWAQIALHTFNKKNRVLLNFRMALMNRLYKEKLEQKISTNCLFIFIVCVKTEAKGNHWQVKLFQCAYRVAQSMFMPFLTYIATSHNDQKRAKFAGFKLKARQYYGLYQEPDGSRPFKKIAPGEYYMELYEKSVQPPVRYQDIIID